MGILVMLYFLWLVIYVVQNFFSYGTAYRLAKTGGDNGVSLYGWLLVLGLASMVPGLGLYLWNKNRYLGEEHISYTTRQSVAQKKCSRCEQSHDNDMSSCPHCGNRD